MTRAATTTEERALALLGAGVPPEQVAPAVGVTVSRISQLLSDPEFTAKVANLRFEALSKHNERDSKYDSIEDRLVDKLSDLLPLMMRPMEVLKAIQVINTAKRRGQSAPDHITNQQVVVSITMPTTIINKFVVNGNNQVIQAGNQELLTIQSGSLLKEAQTAVLERGVQNGTHERVIAATTSDQQSIGTYQAPKQLTNRTQQEESSFDPAGRFVPA